MRRPLAGLALVLGLVSSATVAQAAPACTYQLGFQTIASMLPRQVGACLDDEAHNPANGDAMQHTTEGLLVWRKADNWMAFTDGYHTWVNGPAGLQERLNSQRFSWEANPDGLPIVGSPASSPAPAAPGPAPAIAPVAPGYTRFTSTQYPYQVDYLSSWTMDSAEFLGKKVEVFGGDDAQGATLAFDVLAEPIPAAVTLDTFKDQNVAQLSGLQNDGTPLQTTRLSRAIDGQDAWQLQYDVVELNVKFHATQWLTVHDGQGWVFTMLQAASDVATDSQAATVTHNIIASIHFLSTTAVS